VVGARSRCGAATFHAFTRFRSLPAHDVDRRLDDVGELGAVLLERFPQVVDAQRRLRSRSPGLATPPSPSIGHAPAANTKSPATAAYSYGAPGQSVMLRPYSLDLLLHLL
jgi:hypothetical protein